MAGSAGARVISVEGALRAVPLCSTIALFSQDAVQVATTKRHIEMIHYVICAAAAVVVWLLFLRSRRSPPDAPPVVSSKSGIPLVGILMEFFKSPNSMVQRCLKDYGPVFTIPVSRRVGERERCCIAIFFGT
jgi:hypothetical protein